ncbi:hypothetical protein GP5015_1431 [gamma proteobacterium HTCC5015]|nr:hypothetical protein GP5015_1431 [gamma proteobacterium HTCC5015]
MLQQGSSYGGDHFLIRCLHSCSGKRALLLSISWSALAKSGALTNSRRANSSRIHSTPLI